MLIPAFSDRTGSLQCYGGFAEVWKYEYQGTEVAAKVLRVSWTSDLKELRRVDYSVSQGRTDELTGIYRSFVRRP